MATSSWIIKDWKSGSCPLDGFRIEGDLILKEGLDSYTLVWVDEKNKLCWIDDLPKPMGRSHQVLVYFESGGTYEVTLDLSGKAWTGTLKPGNDGSAGTFGAEANGPLPE